MSAQSLILADQDYPLLNLFWTFLVFFVWIMWFFLLFRVIADVFRSHDLSGWAKTGWLVLVIIFPFLGVFIYLIARGSKIHEHDVKQAQANDAAFRSYVQQAASTSTSSADELAKLAALRDQGVITPDEFTAQKAKVLA